MKWPSLPKRASKIMPKKIYEIGPALGFVIFQCRRIAKKERKREEEKTVKLVEHFPEKL
jgi:hypothetical protein